MVFPCRKCLFNDLTFLMLPRFTSCYQVLPSVTKCSYNSIFAFGLGKKAGLMNKTDKRSMYFPGSGTPEILSPNLEQAQSKDFPGFEGLGGFDPMPLGFACPHAYPLGPHTSGM